MHRVLWVVQGLLAALFLFGGGMKLAMPLDELVAMSGLPGPLLVVVSVAEVLGALGLVLPGLTRIRPGLTVLAAAGLTLIMIGATALTAAGVGGADPAGAIFPLVVGLLCAAVAYGRARLSPLGGPRHEAPLRAAA